VADHNKGMEKIMLAINHLLIIAFIFLPPLNLKFCYLFLFVYLPFAEAMPKEKKISKHSNIMYL